jgi:hypothetical protein
MSLNQVTVSDRVEDEIKPFEELGNTLILVAVDGEQWLGNVMHACISRLAGAGTRWEL